MPPPVYYNENDPQAAAWLRDLIRAGLIPPGHVDERSIADVQADDVRGYTQCHFFAGIGGWAYAIQLAGWPENRPVWTGSCPCQPFSVAGRRKGTADPRHMWPEFRRLIAECEPATVFGEQVASRDGRNWLSGVRVDLEALGYAVGAADLCAAGLGAPHIRQRLFWVGDSNVTGSLTGRIATSATGHRRSVVPNGSIGRMGHPVKPRLEGHAGDGDDRDESRWDNPDETRPAPETGNARGFWDHCDTAQCRDGKTRRVEPGTFPLAHGLPGRVAQLRGLGNAIVPPLAATFIRAFCGSTGIEDMR